MSSTAAEARRRCGPVRLLVCAAIATVCCSLEHNTDLSERWTPLGDVCTCRQQSWLCYRVDRVSAFVRWA